MFTRSLWVRLHRWAGLAMAGFLIVVGLTGSLLAFHSEMERLINPQLYPEPPAGQARLSLGELAARAERLAPQAQVRSVSFGEPGWGGIWLAPRTDPTTGQPYALEFDQLFLDPYSGEELGRREWGAISQGLINLMPFVFKLHYALALDMVGVWILGICALIWTLDCFVGLYLTFPARRPNAGRSFTREGQGKPGWWRRWKPAWLVKRHAGVYRVNFDLHRASGLWLWIALLIFAWSSVYMNLWDTVYTWTTRALFEYKAPWTEIAERPTPLETPALGWQTAQEVGERLMAEQARQQEFTIDEPLSLSIDRVRGVYEYSVHSSRDIQDANRRGMTQVFFDANSGALQLVLLPTGQRNGNTVTSWLYALHMANVFGLPYRIFVCLLGLVIVMLSVTGVYLWLKKRRSRTVGQERRTRPTNVRPADG